MKVYVAMICDRHTDPEPYVFTTADGAINYARAEVESWVDGGQAIDEESVDGWLYSASVGVKGDSVWVVEKETDVAS